METKAYLKFPKWYFLKSKSFTSKHLKDKIMNDKSAINTLKRYLRKYKFRNKTQEKKENKKGKTMLAEHVLDMDKSFVLTVKSARKLLF